MDGILRAIADGMSMEDATDFEVLRYAVGRQITDNKTGAVLDVRRAVLLTLTIGSGDTAKRVAEVFEGDRFDTLAGHYRTTAAERGWTLEIIDGRVLHASTQKADPS